jgi:hypothetical protein
MNLAKGIISATVVLLLTKFSSIESHFEMDV